MDYQFFLTLRTNRNFFRFGFFYFSALRFHHFHVIIVIIHGSVFKHELVLFLFLCTLMLSITHRSPITHSWDKQMTAFYVSLLNSFHLGSIF